MVEQIKKSILIFIPEFPVLSETFIERELAKLAEFEDLDIHIVAIKKGTGAQSDILADKVHYIGLSLKDMINGTVLILKDLSLFFRLLKISLGNKNRFFTDSIYLLLKSYAYVSVFQSYKPDQIHVHFLSEPSTLVYFISEISGLKFSISAHARDVFGSNKYSYLNSELIPEKAEKARFIAICNAKAWKKCIEKAGSKYAHKIILHYHGIDASIFNNIDTSDLPDFQKPFIFSVGRLEEKKGFRYLISAAKILKGRNVAFLIKIAGPGSLYEELLAQINEEGVGDHIEILGGGQGIKNEQVLKYLAKAQIFVLPSIETSDKDAEGIPNTLVEAAYMRKAILTTDTGSIPELIQNNENGLVVVQKNDYALADGLEKLLMNEELRTKLGNNAYDAVVQKFDLNKNIIELKNLLIQ